MTRPPHAKLMLEEVERLAKITVDKYMPNVVRSIEKATKKQLTHISISIPSIVAIRILISILSDCGYRARFTTERCFWAD